MRLHRAAEGAGASETEAFLQSSLIGGIDRIRELFPNADMLAAIDTGYSIQIEHGPAESKATEDPAPDTIVADSENLDREPAQEVDLGLDPENELDLEAEDAELEPPSSQVTDPSLIADFADETREHLEELESSLLRLESDPGDRELLNTIFRSIHTIKGASEYLGFRAYRAIVPSAGEPSGSFSRRQSDRGQGGGGSFDRRPGPHGGIEFSG